MDAASIRNAPSVSSTVLATVRMGTTLEVITQVGSWYRVRLPGDPTKVGYILTRDVRAGGTAATPPPTSPGRQPTPIARRRRGPPRRTFVSVSAGYPAAQLQFKSKVSFKAFLEDGSRTTTYTTRRDPLLDVDGGVELFHGLFVAGGISRFNGSVDAHIDEQVPHPLFFNQPRTLVGSSSDLPREELDIHIQAAVLIPLNKRFHLVVAGGPTWFKLRQTLVSNVNYTDEYPYDTVTFTSAVTEVQEETRFGGNFQANLITMIAKHLGVDGSLRFSHASLSFKGSDGSTFAVPAGGWHAGIGLRVEF